MKDDVVEIIKDLIELATVLVSLGTSIVSYKTIKSTQKKRKKR